jgi:hypothetical protein
MEKLMTIPDTLRAQIDEAYDFRGHVTVKLKDGSAVEGFLYNREFENPRMAEDCFVEIIPKNTEERRRLKIADIAGVTLTGEKP